MSPLTKKTKPPSQAHMLTDPSVPMELKFHLLRQACHDEKGEPILAALLEEACKAKAEDHYHAKVKELKELIRQMEEGPLRIGTFLGTAGSNGFGPRAEIAFTDGSRVLCTLPDESLVKGVRAGDTVWMEAQARAVLHAEPLTELTGEEARLERSVGPDRVEVSLREQGRFVFRASAHLQEQLDRGEAEPGATVVVCAQREIAFGALPPEDGLSHLRFLDRRPVPDVDIERDIGDPPLFLEQVTAFLEREINAPQHGRKYRLRRSWLQLLWGVSGSGKSLSIQGLRRWIAKVSSALTGIPIEELPPRTMRLRSAEVLSKWFGESDKRIDRFFTEVEDLAGRTVTGANGREYELPVLVVCEEIDGLARRRGEDSIHDRVQTNLLEHLDATVNDRFRDRLIVVVCTTNVPGLVDPAMLRRIGAKVECFGRLGRRGFADVLRKHLGERPVTAPGVKGAAAARERIVQDLVAWLYAPAGEDSGQVEVTYVGSSTPETKYRRDFMTGGLVDRAVQQACEDSCRADYEGRGRGGLDSGLLMQTFDEQVRNTVDQLDRTNAGSYLTLPEGARVGSLRRLPRTPVLAGCLERVS